MKLLKDFLLEKQLCSVFTPTQIADLEKFADRLLDRFGIDIEFSKHFGDRMSDQRNVPCISTAELQQLFKKIGRDKAKKIKNPTYGDQAVLVDIQKDLNLPFVVKKTKDNEWELVFKTIMRKPNFQTSNKKIEY